MSRESSQALLQDFRALPTNIDYSLSDWLHEHMRLIDDPPTLAELWEYLKSFGGSPDPRAAFWHELDRCPHVKQHPELYQKFIRRTLLPDIDHINNAEFQRYDDLATQWRIFWEQNYILLKDTKSYAGSITDIAYYLRHGGTERGQ